MVRRVEVDGTALVCHDSDRDGPAVVFVHGLGGSGWCWWSQLATCREAGYRALAYDQRGAGLSDRPPGPYSVTAWAEELEGLLDALEIERAALVGHSVGCMVAEHAAVRLGDRIWGLALCGGALRWRPESAAVFDQRVELAREGRMDEIAATVAATGLSERGRSENPVLHGLLLALIAGNEPRSYADCVLATARATMREPERVRCPTLAFAGSQDPVTPPSFARAIAEAVARGEAAVIDGAAHWCMLEQPGAVNRLLLGFLDRVSPAAR